MVWVMGKETKGTTRVALRLGLCACLGLSGCGPDGASLWTVVPILAGGAAIGGIGYLVGDRSDIELSSETRRLNLSVGQLKVLHFQLRLSQGTDLSQKVTISAEPADAVEVLDPEFTIAASIQGLANLAKPDERVLRYQNINLPRIRALKPGRAVVRINALNSSRSIEVEIANAQT